jgi:hypothetical protein
MPGFINHILNNDISSIEQDLSLENVDLNNPSNCWLLSMAVFRDQVEITTLLLKHGANPNFITCLSTTSVTAIFVPHLATSSLLTAIFKGNRHIVKILLEYGADPNLITNKQHPVFEAVKIARNADILLELLQKGGNPNIESNGFNPLGIAIVRNDIKCIKALEQFGAKTVLINRVKYDSVYSYAYEKNPSLIWRITSRPIEVINHFKTMPRIISGGKEVVMGGIEFLEAEERYIQNQMRSRAFEAANIARSRIKV